MADTYRFRVHDTPNPWVIAVEVEADNPDQARRRAESWMFARRPAGDAEGLVGLTLETA